MMNTSIGIINDQYDKASDNDINRSDEAPLRTVVQKIEQTHILLLTPIWEEVLYEIACDLRT